MSSTGFTASTRDWDPVEYKRARQGAPDKRCLKRVRQDLRELIRSPLEGILVVPGEEDVTTIHALVVGPSDTPYAGGFFYFFMVVPNDYPISPPKVKLMTTAGGTVRFGPNLYADGKVCLSILGTWSGPSWSPAQSIGSVLLSIQSLLNAKPYHNEPGFEGARGAGEVESYNHCVRHETLRIAVCDMVDSETMKRIMPAALHETVVDMFPRFVDEYVASCKQLMHLDGREITDPFFRRKRIFQFGAIQERVATLSKALGSGGEAAAGGEDDTSAVAEAKS